jgi:glycosyltransferase involved in cell wall biosynthesis
VSTRFTVAIPTHNRRETLLLALRGVLAQTRPPEQVLVLCDGCTDGSADAVRGLGDARVDAIELPKLSGYAYAHRNVSLAMACGEAIMWLGDDDLLLPDHLERVGECWDTGVVDLVQTPAVAVEADESTAWLGLDWSLPVHLRTMMRTNTSPMSSVTVRVEMALAVGGWDERLPRGGDWDLWKRLIAGGARTAMTGEPTVLHFRATGRDQAWPLRVRQNADWSARLLDPAALAQLRVQLRTLRARREADWADALESLSRQVERDEAELARLGEVESSLSVELERSQAEVARLLASEATLARVYAGGWWRLRGRVRPLLRFAGRLRRGA